MHALCTHTICRTCRTHVKSIHYLQHFQDRTHVKSIHYLLHFENTYKSHTLFAALHKHLSRLLMKSVFPKPYTICSTSQTLVKITNKNVLSKSCTRCQALACPEAQCKNDFLPAGYLNLAQVVKPRLVQRLNVKSAFSKHVI